VIVGIGIDVVDVARFGDDDSAVAGRIGFKLFSPAWFEKKHDLRTVVNGFDSIKVASLVVAALSKLPTAGRRVRIKVDVTGGFGEPVVAELRARQDKGELDASFQIVDVNFAGESSDAAKYPVVRDELWFGCRPWFQDGGAMYPDPKLESELMAATFALDPKGRNKVEPKKDMKKRLGRSPDRADATLLAIYEAPGIPLSSVKQPTGSGSRWASSNGRGFG